MKNKKKTSKTKAGPAARHAAKKRRVVRNRPLHRRLFLHPVSIMFLLCVGVLLGGLTFRSSADSYDITAVVPAPLPNAPAVITSPPDQTHFTTKPITVTGTCPENTYVKLNRNGVFSGAAICGSSQTMFQISTDLSPGSNVLLPQVYNNTDQAGPPSTPITVYYDTPAQPAAPVPSTIPSSLRVTALDNVPFQNGVIMKVSPFVTARGVAPPYSHVITTFRSTNLACTTYADGNGNWSCTLDQALPLGVHKVLVTAMTPEGKALSFPDFQVRISDSVAPLQRLDTSLPFYITSDFRYQPRISAKPFSLYLSLAGGAAPYAVTIQWGDGKTSTIARADRSKFSVNHTYILSKTNQQVYIVKIQAVDSKASASSLQVVELVRSSGWLPGAPLVSDAGGNTPPLSLFRQWIWFAWPAYAVTVLMVLSFWLGERQEYYNLFRRKNMRHRRA